MTDYHELVPIPPLTDMNTGLTAARQSTMISLLGRPGRLTRDCSPLTNPTLKAQIVTAGIGTFSVSGWKPAVISLQAVFNEIHTEQPELWKVLKSAGMLCCRAVRGSQTDYSNHSWGTAIDLRVESELDELGAHVVQRGILLAYPFFHRHGWFWGAGYRHRKDPMHFELADETIRNLVNSQ